MEIVDQLCTSENGCQNLKLRYNNITTGKIDFIFNDIYIFEKCGYLCLESDDHVC